MYDDFGYNEVEAAALLFVDREKATVVRRFWVEIFIIMRDNGEKDGKRG